MSRRRYAAPNSRSNRRKVSTTVSPETQEYLETLIAQGAAANLAEALDLLVAQARRQEQHLRLERDTAAYFDSLSGGVLTEESHLGATLASAADEIDFDG